MSKKTWTPLGGSSYLRFRLPPSSQTDGQSSPAKKPRLDTDSFLSNPKNLQHADLACLRCRRQKKKCCRTLPECSACVAAGVHCFFPTKGNSSISATNWLSQDVSVIERAQLPSPTDTISPSAWMLPWRREHNENFATSVSETADAALSTLFHAVRDERRGASFLHSVRLHVPPWADIPRLVGAYFRHVHKAYPFLDQSQILGELDCVGSNIDGGSSGLSPQIYLLCALGAATLHRVGKLSDETLASISVPYENIVSSCLMNMSIDSASILMLLTIFSLFDPVGMSPWVLTGLLGRQVIALGLNRRSSTEHGFTLQEVEQRHRLFWSIYALDREIASSFGLPVAINDENVNVPLPSVTIDEYASPSRSYHTRVLQVCRNATALRDLEGQILQKVHLSNPISTINIGRADRQGVIDRFRSQLDNWYANGCLLSQSEDDEISFHDTIPWLNVRYHGLLILLHCPSRFNSYFSREQLGDLHQSIQKYLQCSAVLLRQQHLMHSHCTLNRLLLVCVLLVLCLQQGKAELSGQYNIREGVLQCSELLEAFPSGWLIAKRSLLVFRALENFLATFTSSELHTSSIILDQAALRKIRADAFGILQEALGPSSVYNKLYEESVDTKFETSANSTRTIPIPV